MRLYLVQHAEAKSKEEDPQRSLTAEGRQNAEAVAALTSKLGFNVTRIFNSGKTRALETANILGDVLKPAKGGAILSGLGPLDDVVPIAKDMMEKGEDVVLVGHLPFMERLVGYLVVKDPEQPIVQFQNAGIVCLTGEDNRWQVSWILSSDLAKACR